MTKRILQILSLLILVSVTPAMASGGGVEIPKQSWPHKGWSGTYDKAALQRGFQVYRESCSSCHSMKRLSYRNLTDIGFTAEEVKAVAAEYTVMDGPNDEGEMFERSAKPSDFFVSPFANDNAARYANNGALPPDMSLLVKARTGGEDYIFALLTGYKPAPEGAEIMEGMSWNTYFPGHAIAMTPPLADGQVTYSDGTSASLEQAARDVSQFLVWASEPHMEKRKRMGSKVLFFLVILCGVLYASKRKLWANVK